ncbi:LuxR C-terminal-related transcriptional regulator [Kovacikia minuta CCNUW1]|uniref:helix-turn-helix transcriptional regulator n=1 Tax=Kovacikia minuta TaxID=2931930 RepID=UPI001CD038E6|nr:LuxR C-terminal-related transcriptional regulator [Kovacikia minuta]UBF26244.1 LuxR C-terminal-related transcriptional regulator [Kovacikia minuta CCNUW1]
MTAPLFSVSLESAPVSSLFSDRFSGSSSGVRPQRRTPSVSPCYQRSGHPVRKFPTESHDFNLVWSSLIEAIPQGVVVASRSLKPIYWNQKAKELCECLSNTAFTLVELPLIVSEICRRLIRENRSEECLLVMEYQTPEGQTIRISARWLHPAPVHENSSTGPFINLRDIPSKVQDEQRQPYILVFLENCNDILQEELRIEQKKYDLTEREAEIWMLLRQEYTYQEIARMLQISLNTVKTHVKNVYAKRRSFHGQERFWCSE